MAFYPEFTITPDMPPSTRMLLDNDGSTTVLLRSLVGSAPSVEVLPEARAETLFPDGRAVDGRVADVFGTDGHDLGIRRSRLRDARGAVISENIITFRLRDGDSLIPGDTTPFGLHTRNLGLFERRRILVAGITLGSFGLLPAGSPGRVYEIEFSSRTRVLVHEIFNPRFVSAGVLGTTDGNGSRTGPEGIAAVHDHQPEWPVEAEVRRARAVLAHAAPLVSHTDIRRLRSRLVEPTFLLHAGDCAETFRDNTQLSVASRIALLHNMSDVIEAESGRSVVTVGRIAGQYAKPRSSPLERRAELALPSYFGDAVNDADFSAGRRTPDPWNLIRAYEESGKTLAYLGKSGVFTSHEALLLDYEQPQTRRRPDDGLPYDHSAHLLWIGERTRSLTGPHIAFAAEVANPIAVKVGPSATPDDVLALHAAINPDNAPGRLAFIFRMGRERAYDRTHALLSRVAAEGLADRFLSDPMHGNTVSSPAGVKTRVVVDIEAELRGFFSACNDIGITPGGIHLEVSGDEVSECVATEIDDEYLATNYRSACDPRLNPEQALQIAQVVGELLAATPELELTA